MLFGLYLSNQKKPVLRYNFLLTDLVLPFSRLNYFLPVISISGRFIFFIDRERFQ